MDFKSFKEFRGIARDFYRKLKRFYRITRFFIDFFQNYKEFHKISKDIQTS